MNYRIASLLIALTTTFLLAPVHGQDMGHVIMPDADLMIQVKLASIQKSAIFKAMTELKNEQKQKGSAAEVAGIEKTDKTIDGLRQMTGLEYSDFLLLVATAKLDGMSLNSAPEVDTVNALIAVKLAKELPMDRLETGLKSFLAKQAEEEGTPAPTITRAIYGDTGIIQVKEADAKELICLTMTNDDTLLLVGPQAAVEGAVDRYKSGNNTSPGKLFPVSVGKAVGRSSSYLLLKPTPDMLAKMGTQDANESNPAKDLMGKLKALGLGLHFDENLDLSLVGAFPTAEQGQQASMLIDPGAVPEM
jgi:hypothetical protein